MDEFFTMHARTIEVATARFPHVIPYRESAESADPIAMLAWCQERFGPCAVSVYDEKDPGLWRPFRGTYWFAKSDQAFEFKVRWG